MVFVSNIQNSKTSRDQWILGYAAKTFSMRWSIHLSPKFFSILPQNLMICIYLFINEDFSILNGDIGKASRRPVQLIDFVFFLMASSVTSVVRYWIVYVSKNGIIVTRLKKNKLKFRIRCYTSSRYRFILLYTRSFIPHKPGQLLLFSPFTSSFITISLSTLHTFAFSSLH